MFFSGKISNSFLAFLSRNGLDISTIYEMTDIPMEFLRDPTYWLEADQVEAFLKKIETTFHPHFPGENVIEKVGLVSAELGAWGVLDSVLKMMASPSDIFHQPQRFISYFVSPAPPLGQIQKAGDRISFEIPISSDRYPFTTTFIRSALAGLPKFMQAPEAKVQWVQTKLVIDWSNGQESFLAQDEARQMDPAFVRQLLERLESLEGELQEKNRQLLEHETIKENMNSALLSLPESESGLVMQDLHADLIKLDPSLREIQGQFMRMIDYQTRAQQLIALLSAGQRGEPAVEKAFHRVDWEFVKTEFNNVVDQGVEHLKHVRSVFSDWSQKTRPKKVRVRTPEQISLFADEKPQKELEDANL